ncbi:hypothetical protein [Streptomyces sp. NPDC001401]|uniref:hypothetical protein n=1 Tax=Streptomyces sp. NPDC001401 TaxID=3364570 RepID=UPI00367FC93E
MRGLDQGVEHARDGHHHSRDPAHWTQIGNALDRPSQLRLPLDSPSSGGIYADWSDYEPLDH